MQKLLSPDPSTLAPLDLRVVFTCFIFGAGNRTQDLAHAGQMLNHFTTVWPGSDKNPPEHSLGKERREQEEGREGGKQGGREAAAQMPEVKELFRKGGKSCSHKGLRNGEDAAAKTSKKSL